MREGGITELVWSLLLADRDSDSLGLERHGLSPRRIAEGNMITKT